MKLLVIGKGYLGTAFEDAGHTVVRFRDIDPTTQGFDDLDCIGIHWAIDKSMPTAVVNCAALTNTSECEQNEHWETAFYLNSEFPGVLANLCKDRKITLVHVSTGCIYNEGAVDAKEGDNQVVAAHCRYSLTKWMGERYVSQFGDLNNVIILRPRVLFDERNLPRNMMVKQKNFTLFSEAQETLTYVPDVVGATEALLNAEARGVFNVGCLGTMSRMDVARASGNFTPKAGDPDEIRRIAGFHLVRNTMSGEKLAPYYKTHEIHDVITDCAAKLFGYYDGY